MTTLLMVTYAAILLLQLGAALLGWMGRFAPALRSLALSCGGLLALQLLLPAVASSEGDDSSDWLSIASLSGAVLTAILLGVVARGQRTTDSKASEPDYPGIARHLQDELDKTVEANKAARATRRFGD